MNQEKVELIDRLEWGDLEDFITQLKNWQIEEPYQKIGILGGSFNPPHLGHLITADQVGKCLGLDKVFLMPSNEPPHREGKVSLAKEHRENMVDLAVADNPYLGVEKIELNRPGKSYTVDTIKLLKEKYPETEIYFIIGADMVESLSTWKDIDELLTLVQFVGVQRAGYSMETDYPILTVDLPIIEFSSTDIRKRVANHRSICYMTPIEVEWYIQKEGLYRD